MSHKNKKCDTIRCIAKPCCFFYFLRRLREFEMKFTLLVIYTRHCTMTANVVTAMCLTLHMLYIN